MAARDAPIRGIAIGRRDVERDLPVTRDTIFRIASMTKPVTTVAALTLLDEGRFGLDEPDRARCAGARTLARPADPEGRSTTPSRQSARSRSAICSRIVPD